MELKDYLAALRRHWAIWIGATLAGALAALLAFSQTPTTYEATAGVFVSPSDDGSAQFVQQRVKSYPEIVTSEAVLDPVVTELELDTSLADLRSRVSARNPAETTQLYVTVTGSDAEETAAIANAVSIQFADVVEELETPATGVAPVNLTVADPAVVPESPVSPVLLYLMALGVVAGLLLGLAAAVVRSRMDTRIHGEDDLRRAWEDDAATEILVQPSGRARRSALTGDPALTLARRLELRAEDQPVHLVLLSPSPAEEPATRAFAEKVVTALYDRGVDATGPGSELVTDVAQVRLEVADPLVPLRVWRRVARSTDGVVLVLTGGRVESGELRETQGILRSAGITPLAVVLLRRERRERRARIAVAPAGVPTPSAERASEPRPATVSTQPSASGSTRG